VRATVLIASATVILSACGTPRSTTTAASPTTTASASRAPAATPPVLLVVQTKAATSDQPGSISLFSAEGTSAGTLQLKPGWAVLAVAGSRIFIRTGDGSLDALKRDGTLEVLEPAANTVAGIGGLIASPDGKEWVWASQTPDTTSQSLYLAGDTLTTHKVATFAYATVLQAYVWTPQGIFLDSLPPDFNGYRPFNTTFGAFGGVRRLDPKSGTLATVSTPNCVFSDQAPDGSIACFPKLPGYLLPTRHMLRIISGSGTVSDLSLATPRFNYLGDAYFSPDGSVLTVAGATGAGNDFPQNVNPSPKPEEYGTDLVQTVDGSIKKFGPIGTRPAMGANSWLPDGRLVLWRPDSFGGSPGLYVLDPRGTGEDAEIIVSGDPIGYLTG
jgi:hypothetical protein